MLVEHLVMTERTSYCVLLIGLGLDVKYLMLDQLTGNNTQINSRAAQFNAAMESEEKGRMWREPIGDGENCENSVCSPAKGH